MKAEASLVVVQYGGLHLLGRLLASLEQHPDRQLFSDLVIVNNGPILPNVIEAFVRPRSALPFVVVPNLSNNYAAAANVGVRAAMGQLIILTNNDVEWLPGESLSPAVATLMKPAVGVVGVELSYPDGSWQQSHGRYPGLWSGIMSVLLLDSAERWLAKRRSRDGARQMTRPVQYIAGAVMCIRRECFNDVGGFDEAFRFYGEDVDFCFRARRLGWAVLLEPRARMLHVGGASSKRVDPAKFASQLMASNVAFVEKHGRRMRARVYERMTKLAIAERAVLYRVLALGARSSFWAAKAQEISIVHAALRSR